MGPGSRHIVVARNGHASSIIQVAGYSRKRDIAVSPIYASVGIDG
jgi:hypothetical protein